MVKGRGKKGERKENKGRKEGREEHEGRKGGEMRVVLKQSSQCNSQVFFFNFPPFFIYIFFLQNVSWKIAPFVLFSMTTEDVIQ